MTLKSSSTDFQIWLWSISAQFHQRQEIHSWLIVKEFSTRSVLAHPTSPWLPKRHHSPRWALSLCLKMPWHIWTCLLAVHLIPQKTYDSHQCLHKIALYHTFLLDMFCPSLTSPNLSAQWELLTLNWIFTYMKGLTGVHGCVLSKQPKTYSCLINEISFSYIY